MAEKRTKTQVEDGSKPDVDGVSLDAHPPRTPHAGGSGAVGHPEDGLPDHLERMLKERGSASTASTYRSHARKFVDWLHANRMTFANMPPGTGERFVTETVNNTVTRNVARAALRATFDLANIQGLRFIPQELVREKAPRKPKAVQPPTPPTVAGLPVVQSGAPMSQPVEVPVTPAPVAAPVAPVPVVQQPRVAPAIPSMGKRLRLSKTANTDDIRAGRAHSHGQNIDVGDYQSDVLESSDGGAAGFIMKNVRRIYGGGVYRLTTLSTTGQPIVNQYVDLHIGPDPLADETPNGHQPVTVAAPLALPMARPMDMGTAFSAPALMERMTENALRRADEERKEYELRKKELEEKRSSGQMNDMQFFVLMNQLTQSAPKPVDPKEIARQAREEYERYEKEKQANQPPPAPLAPAAPLMFDPPPPPKPDMGMEALVLMMRQQSEMNMMLMTKLLQPPPPPPPQKDPMEMAMTLANILAPKKSAVEEQMLTLAIQNLTNPPKVKSLAESLGEIKMLKNAMADDTPQPSLSESIFETIHHVIENVDKIGPALSQIRTGGLAGFQPRPGSQPQPTAQRVTPPQPAGAPRPKPAAQTPAAQQPSVASKELQQAFINMIRTPEEDDLQLVRNLVAVLDQMNKDGGLFTQYAGRVQQLYLQASTKADVHLAIVHLFKYCGLTGSPLMSNPQYMNRLTDVLHLNYPVIYGMMTQGGQKTLADAPTVIDAESPAAPAQEAVSQSTPQAAGPADETDEDEEDEEDDDDEEGDEVELASGSQPSENSTALAVGT